MLCKKQSKIILVAWMMLYGITYRLSESLSEIIGINHIVTVLSMMLYWYSLFVYMNKNDYAVTYYICFPKNKKVSKYFVYIPLLLMAAVNATIFINGRYTIDPNIKFQNIKITSVINLLTEHLIAVSCVIGEEVFFRGIFLASLVKQRLRAIIVTSLSFSLMHILNMLSEKTFYYVVIQVLNAAAVGFCLAVVSCIEHSIIPGIVIHSLINISSLCIDDCGTGVTEHNMDVVFGVLPIIYIIYGIYLYRKGQERKML